MVQESQVTAEVIRTKRGPGVAGHCRGSSAFGLVFYTALITQIEQPKSKVGLCSFNLYMVPM